MVWSGPTREVMKKEVYTIGEMDFKTTKGEALPTPTFGFYFYDSSKELNNLFILATNALGETKWSNLITAPKQPDSFRYDETLDQLTVFYFPQDQLPEGEGITSYVVIDRSGTVR